MSLRNIKTDRPAPVAVPHFGPSNIDQLLESLKVDTEKLSSVLNGFSWTKYQQKKINRSVVLPKLKALVEAWEKIEAKANAE